MYKFILPIRYFLKRRITSLAVMSVALCVFIVIVVMTVHNGVVVEFREKNHDFVGDCIVSTDSLVGFAYYDQFLAELDKQDFIPAASAVIKSFGLLGQPGRETNIGIEIMGIEPESFCRVTGFGRTLYYHEDDPEKAFEHDHSPNYPGCVVGVIMMLGGTDRAGKYYHSEHRSQYELIVSCFPLTAKGALAKAGTDIINTKSFYYSDDSHTRIPKVDSSMIYLPFDYAQKLCGMAGTDPRANAIHIKFTQNISVADGCEKVRKMWSKFIATNSNKKYSNLFDNVTVQNWTDYRRSSIAPMEKEQAMLTMLFIMLGIITIFVIFVVFYMIISHKSKDIGILKSIGVSNANIVQIFLGFAMIVGIVGTGIGTAGGCAFLTQVNGMESWLFDHFGWQLWDRSVYAIGDIPNNVEWKILTIIITSAILASLVGAVVPAFQAARSRPVETLQVNQL